MDRVTIRRRRGHRIPSKIALAFLGASCSYPTDPPLPPGSHAFAPPPVFATWWRMTEQCSGIVRPMSSVSWVEVPGNVPLLPKEAPDIHGYFSIRSSTIVLDSSVALHGDFVRHEMLHALLRVPGHSRAAFLGACGGVVGCTGLCATDVGAPPAQLPGAIDVEPQDLTVNLAVVPQQPSGAIDDGFFHLVVSVTNPDSIPVTAILPNHPYPNTFGYRLGGPTGGVEADLRLGDPSDTSVIRFAPHETKIQVFDVQIGSIEYGLKLVPGRYLVVGVYDDHLALDSITLAP